MKKNKCLTINRLSSGGLITNYYCSSSCGHCLYYSSPQWKKEYITRERAIQLFEKIGSLGCGSIHIGGGEPCLDAGKLKTVLETADEAGMTIEYVETNSSWFKDEDSAVETLEMLRTAGLSTLLISISPFHNAYIPFYKVKGVMEACRRAGVSIFPWVQGFWSDLDRLPDKVPHSMEEYEMRLGPGYLKKIPSRYWIHMGGRAMETFAPLFKNRDIQTLTHSRTGCVELEDVSHFHFDLYGNYVPALCSGITIDYRDMGNPLPEEKYPYITLLYNGGPAALFQLAVEEFGYQSKEGYVSKCHLCQDIRRFLVLEKGEALEEFGPEQYYKEMAE